MPQSYLSVTSQAIPLTYSYSGYASIIFISYLSGYTSNIFILRICLNHIYQLPLRLCLYHIYQLPLRLCLYHIYQLPLRLCLYHIYQLHLRLCLYHIYQLPRILIALLHADLINVAYLTECDFLPGNHDVSLSNDVVNDACSTINNYSIITSLKSKTMG